MPCNPTFHWFEIFFAVLLAIAATYGSSTPKNSWGETGDYKGVWYMTKTFIAANTMDFLINKNAIPKDIRKKLGI